MRNNKEGGSILLEMLSIVAGIPVAWLIFAALVLS